MNLYFLWLHIRRVFESDRLAAGVAMRFRQQGYLCLTVSVFSDAKRHLGNQAEVRDLFEGGSDAMTRA